MVHATKNCRWCADAIDVEWLERHEAKCKNKTDAQREQNKRTRLHGRTAYHQQGRRNPKVASDLRRSSTTCRYCHQEIGRGQMPMHEASCRRKSPAERTEATKLRIKQRGYGRTHWNRRQQAQYGAGVPALKNGARPVGRPPGQHYSFWANGNGKRLSATISIDFKHFRALILELAPSLSIDKVEVI